MLECGRGRGQEGAYRKLPQAWPLDKGLATAFPKPLEFLLPTERAQE